MSIRPVKNDEITKLHDIMKQTFVTAYHSKNTKENMAHYVRTKLNIDYVRDEYLNDHSYFYFADIDDATVGYLKLNHHKAQTELQDPKSLEIERIYVLQDHQGQGIGQKMISFCKQKAQDQSLEYVWLGVWEKNPDAIEFYKRQGFVQFDKHIFSFGDQQQTDLLMKCEVSSISKCHYQIF